MIILLFLLPLSVVMATLALASFIWSAQSGQLDDLTSPPSRILHDEPSSKDKRRS